MNLKNTSNACTQRIFRKEIGIMKIEQLVSVLDILTYVEVLKTGDGLVYKGKLKDINPVEMANYRVYRVIPCATSRETYLEIDVY